MDICFGLGYNTLATLYYLKKQGLDKKITVYSPELDAELLKQLSSFEYPKEFQEFFDIIQTLSKELYYEDESLEIEIYNRDAREYIKALHQKGIFVDIVYQDPFSSEVNKSLWTVEYFKDISLLLNEDAIVTTYSIATPVRLSMYESGLYIYEITNKDKRKSTVAFKTKIDQYKYIDMELKKQRNKSAKALRD